MNHQQQKKIKKGLSRVMQRDLSVVSLWGANGPVNKAMYCTSQREKTMHTVYIEYVCSRVYIHIVCSKRVVQLFSMCNVHPVQTLHWNVQVDHTALQSVLHHIRKESAGQFKTVSTYLAALKNLILYGQKMYI